MAEYEKTEWVDFETVIDAEKLNKIEQGIYDANTRTMTPGPKGDKGDPGAVGAKGDKGDTGAAGAAGAKGADGKSVKALALTTDAAGKVTGGTCTLSDNSTVAVTVTTAGA